MTFIPSLTLGCGLHMDTTQLVDNVSAINLLNIKKVGKRRNNMQWFKVPSKNLLRTQFYPIPSKPVKILNAL